MLFQALLSPQKKSNFKLNNSSPKSPNLNSPTTSAGSLLIQAKKFLKNQEFASSEKSFEKYLELYPNNFNVKMILVLQVQVDGLKQYEKGWKYLNEMLIYDKENSEILAAMYHIISLMIAQNIVQNQYSLLPLKEGISNMLDHFTNLITAEKKALKARSFSANAIKHTTNVLKSLLTKNIPGIATGPFLDLVLQILGEKETCTLLHLDYLSLLTLQNQNETLLTYIESCTSQGGHFLQNNLDWLVHAQKCLEEIGSSGTRQTIIALKVSSLAGFLAFSKPSNSTTKDIGLICENVMAFIAKQIDDSNPALKDASSLTKEWTDCKLEMQATLSLFKALLDLSRISNPLEPSSTICKEVLENVLTALSYSPAQPNSFPHFIRQSRALTILKVFVYNIDMDWVDGFLLMAPPFSIAKTTASKSTFENSLALPSLDFTISKVVETIPRLKKYTKLIRDVDKSDITLLAMMQNPNSLFEIVQYAFWNARVGSLRLFTFLESIFPSLPKHHLVYENIDGSNQSMKGDGTSPTKSYRYNTKLTPTISDLEAFLAMMLLERQAACLDLCNSTKFEEFIFSTLKTNLWTPSEEACTFWNAVVSKYAHFNTLVEGITKKTSQLHSPSLVKCIENGVLQIRGESKDSKNFKDTYGLLGLFFLRSYVKESQDFWIPAKYYMEVYKRFESVVAQPEDKMAFTGLLSKILYEVGLVIDVKSLGNRVKEGVDLTVFDLKLCFDNVKRRSTSVNSSHLDFSKRVSFDTGIIHSSTSSSERIFSPQRLSLPAVDGKRNSSTVKSGLNSSTVKSGLNSSTVKSGLESSPLVPKLAQKPILKKEPEETSSLSFDFTMSANNDGEDFSFKVVQDEDSTISFSVPQTAIEGLILPKVQESVAKDVASPSVSTFKDSAGNDTNPFQGVDWSEIQKPSTLGRRKRLLEIIQK